MTERFLGALQFLTVIPVRAQTAPLGRCAPWFPLIGAALGALAGLLLRGTATFLSTPIAALLSITFLLAITGCLHEDGLADVADAVRAGRSREKILSILKDSRIGTYGAAALVISLLLRWQSLTECRVNPIAGLAATLALSRASLVLLAAFTPAAGDGLGTAFRRDISRPAAWFVAIQAVALAFLADFAHGAALLTASAAIIYLARMWFIRRLGGVTGDCLGATCQSIETINLMILAWRPFF